MQRYEVTIAGKTPLLMHPDDIDWADHMAAWKEDPANKKISVAGDDRSPAWRWIGNLYHDDKFVVIPADNLMTALREGGAMVPVPGGRSGKTFKAQTQSGMMINEPFWTLEANGNQIAMADITPLMDEAAFSIHRSRVSDLGFSLFVKRAKIQSSKHVRVRPRFDKWSASGTVTVWDEQITDRVLADIFEYAGRYKGLGDWRPSSPKSPGTYGTFDATVKKI